MCTAAAFRNKSLYFGRNLDLDTDFGQKVVITPRKYTFAMKNGQTYRNLFGMIGMAAVEGKMPGKMPCKMPLYAEAMNEKGLVMAGLNFPDNAVYYEERKDMDNITPFEFIPWIVGQAADVQQAVALLYRVNLLNVPFNEKMPLQPLHFMLSDGTMSVVVETDADKMHIYRNPFDVLTNNPGFEYHYWNMQNMKHLSAVDEGNSFGGSFELHSYCAGMGAMGLPGDLSSPSRFVRAAFHLANASCEPTEQDSVSQVFHIMDSVAMTQGSVITSSGTKDITRYTCCLCAKEQRFYYKTYTNSRLTAVDLTQEALSSPELTVFELRTQQSVLKEN